MHTMSYFVSWLNKKRMSGEQEGNEEGDGISGGETK